MKVRPCLPRGFPRLDRADELHTFRLEPLASGFDVVHEKPDDRSRGDVGVLGVRGAEDLWPCCRQTSEYWLKVAMIRLMLKRLGRN
jgi:hypothetical protein